MPANAELRGGLVERFGETGYKAIFGVVSLVGPRADRARLLQAADPSQQEPDLWVPPVWSRHIALALMLPAMIALVAAYVPSHIHTWLKHPMLVAIKIWALAHLLANGDLASLVLFGSFLAFAVYDRISVKRRHAPGPLGAKTGPWCNDLIVVGVGTALYLAVPPLAAPAHHRRVTAGVSDDGVSGEA